MGVAEIRNTLNSSCLENHENDFNSDTYLKSY